jgi:UDP-N-acetylglucosamine transferase subunit ALG13
MMFVTVGTQGPFDRLIRAIDEWAGTRGRADIFAQIGPSDFRPEHIRSAPFVGADEFKQHVEVASLIVAHAGMGSIITALELGKRIVVMPRRADLGEHRNDHQIATARRLSENGRILTAIDRQELHEKLDELQNPTASERLSSETSPDLIRTIRMFIEAKNIRFDGKMSSTDSSSGMHGMAHPPAFDASRTLKRS